MLHLKNFFLGIVRISLFIFLLCLCTMQGISAEQVQNKYAGIDNHALKTPASKTKSIESLASYLTGPAKNDTEKARAIYRWITENISYDVPMLLKGTPIWMSADEVLKKRITVCQGYSILFVELGKNAGLEVVTIPGFAKGYSYIPGGKDDDVNHAWNAVKINGDWRLLDTTWGAGYIDDNGKYIRRLENHYFLTPPEELIYTHLPEDKQWQLLRHPISKSNFQMLISLKPSFFSYGLKIASHRESIITTGKYVTVDLQTPDDVAIIGTVLRKDVEQDKTLVFSQFKDGIYSINAIFPQSGKYTLRIFAARGREETYDWVLDYTVMVSTGAGNNNRFPLAYGDFRYRQAYLHSPMTGRLKSGVEYDFKIDVPGAEDVVLLYEKTHLLLERVDGDTFTGRMKVGNHEITVGARFPGDDRFAILLKYTN